jgi:hypothetical protein
VKKAVRMRRAFMVQLLVAAPVTGVVTGIFRDRFARFNDAGTRSMVSSPSLR